MDAQTHAIIGFALAAILGIALTPVAARAAARIGFLDHPVGYKQHGRSTPYLGGAAVMIALFVPGLLVGGLTDELVAIGIGAAALWVVGTIDDGVSLSPWARVAAEVLAAVGLWLGDAGWSLFASDVANLLLTVVWVLGVVNAFNLMDNLDGAAGTVAAASGIGIGSFALVNGDEQLAGLAWALSGACVGFLRYNLARPARIFLGDGGSMPIGFVAAAAAIAAPPAAGLGRFGALACAAMLVGLVILDTTLVVISRRRRGISLLTGGRDHLTHRLLAMTGTPQAVAATLGALQLGLGAVALTAAVWGRHAVLWTTIGTVLIGVAVIAVLEIRFSVARHVPVPARSGE